VESNIHEIIIVSQYNILWTEVQLKMQEIKTFKEDDVETTPLLIPKPVSSCQYRFMTSCTMKSY